MTNTVDFRAFTNSVTVPVMVFVDLQQEYVSAPRGLAIPNAGPALANCAIALKSARAAGMPIAHVRWAGRSNFFNPATPFAKWIDGFVPLGSEMIFERSRPSCYASRNFAEIMDEGEGEFVLAGFAGRIGVPVDPDRRVSSRPPGDLSGRRFRQPRFGRVRFFGSASDGAQSRQALRAGRRNGRLGREPDAERRPT